MDPAEEVSTMHPCLLAVLGALIFYLTTSSPLSLCFIRMPVTDCRSGFSDPVLFIAPRGLTLGFNESPFVLAGLMCVCVR